MTSGAERPEAADRRSLLQNALAAIERLQARLDAAEAASREPIAIVGLGCRTPGGVADAEAFWDLLEQGRDVVGTVPPDRWDVSTFHDPDPAAFGKAHTQAGGFLDDVFGFEPGFFGMSPREATALDPQQRLLLEVAWEALEHAAIAPDGLGGSRTGVFVGITSTDYAQRIDITDPARSDIYLATGTALNAAAGRLSFTLGLQGPCMAIDTACSSSLVAIHTACQSLRNGESTLALAGGVNLMLAPEPYVLISKWGMLSPDGRCKTFDASANGFVRGEGCGLLVLERLSDALAHRRRVLAVIRGSAINQDGRSSGLTVPNGIAQQAVIRQALAAANLRPADVDYVEAHGTGTSLGDPIEIEALAAAYGPGRDKAAPLEVGSVKSNIGHLEAASGVTGLIKTVLALQHRRLPASLHVTQPTPAVDWNRLPLRVSTTLHDWPAPHGARRAGVSAFGFSGMNAHVIVEEAPPAPAMAAPAGGPQLFVLSAHSEAALDALAARHAAHLAAHPALPLADVCATLAQGRAHLGHRLALVAADVPALLQGLATPDAAVRGRATPGVRPRVAFLFTGQGAQQVGMGRELDATEPVFRATLDRCAAVLDPLLERPLREVLFTETGLLDRTGHTQPALFALEVSLAALWRHWGIEPSVVIGHSVGEYAAAVVAGVLTLEDGARLIAARARLMQALPEGGAMLAVQGDVDAVERALADGVAIAARNAPGQVVIAGTRAAVDAVGARLTAQGLRTQPLPVSHAFHSPLMEPMLEEFRRIAAGVAHAAPRIAWISNLGGGLLDWAAWGHRMADYWTRHVREPVAFEPGIGTLLAQGCDAALEIGPGATLTGLAQACAGPDGTVAWLPSLRRGRPAAESLRDALARLYVRGATPDWRALGAGARAHLRLPTTVFQRQRLLVEAAPARGRAAGSSVHPLLGERLPAAGLVALFERRVHRQDPAWLADHVIGGETVMPLTAWIEAAHAAAQAVRGAPAAVHDLDVAAPMSVDAGARTLQVVVDDATAGPRVRIFSRADGEEAWTLHASARIGNDSAPLPEAPPVLATEAVDPTALYDRLGTLGITFGPSFRALRTLHRGRGEATGEVELPPSLTAEAARMSLHPALLDACFHVAALAIESQGGAGRERVYLPVGVDAYRSLGAATTRLVSQARVRAGGSPDLLRVDILVQTPDGRPVARLDGLRCQRVSRGAQAQRWLYETGWRPLPLPADAPLGGRWVVLDDGDGESAGSQGARLAAEIARRGGAVERIAAGAPLDALRRQPAPAGVVSLRALRVPALTDDQVPGALQQHGSEAALALVQALAAAPAPLWLVTSGTEAVDGSETPNPAQAPVAGLARVAALEHPELRVTHVDLDTPPSSADLRALADLLAAGAAEPRVALRKGQAFVARLQRLAAGAATSVDDAPAMLVVEPRGTLDNLRMVPMARRAPGPGEVELRVHASGLNFRDVLLALGLYPGEVPRLGSDGAGEVVAVGAGVTGLAVGDRVVAMVEGAFATHATTRAEFVAPLPAEIPYERAASLPSAWLTAEITLNQIARLQAGQRVLVHAGAGGVGMAAVALALRAGAEVFATAGSDEKRAVLAAMGVPHVLDSRAPAFADEVLRRTGGRGVDVVLNSLAGAMMDRSFEVTAEGGTFLEIGKRDLWSAERVAALGRGIRYHVVDCSERARETPQIVGATFRRVVADIASGALPPLPITTFALADAAAAFRHMAQARHIGRVVLRHPADAPALAAPVRADAAYLVTGGTRGIGLVTARWLVEQGARRLVLASRSAPDAAAQAEIDALRAAGAEVDVVAADLGRDDGVEALMQALHRSGRPLGGVLHGAAALDDGVLLRQDAGRLAAAMAAKADGAWRLDRALRRHGFSPDFFVLHSSMSATLGSPGQGNYVAANAFLDVLARHRRMRGLPATAVAWGAWQAVGMAARGGAAARAGDQGFEALEPAQGVQALERLLETGTAHAAVAPVDWSRVAQLGGGGLPLLRELLGSAEAGRDTADAATPDLAALPADERSGRLGALLRRELSVVLGLPAGGSALADDTPFTSLGLDSLANVELRNRLQRAIGRPVAATAPFDHPTVGGLVAHLGSLFAADAREELTL